MITAPEYEQSTLPHWAEYSNHDDPGETLYWVYHPRMPRGKYMYMANRVVRKNKDGTFQYIKNRAEPTPRIFSEEESRRFLFTVLGAKTVQEPRPQQVTWITEIDASAIK